MKIMIPSEKVAKLLKLLDLIDYDEDTNTLAFGCNTETDGDAHHKKDIIMQGENTLYLDEAKVTGIKADGENSRRVMIIGDQLGAYEDLHIQPDNNLTISYLGFQDYGSSVNDWSVYIAFDEGITSRGYALRSSVGTASIWEFYSVSATSGEMSFNSVDIIDSTATTWNIKGAANFSNIQIIGESDWQSTDGETNDTLDVADIVALKALIPSA